MNLFTLWFIFFLGIYTCNAGYLSQPQLDVQAPAYVPPYAKNTGYRYSASLHTKSRYGGTKTAYLGTKTAYSGTKTGYAGTKTAHTGTKSHYGEQNTWYSGTGSEPGFQEFYGNANEGSFESKCEIPCKNDGICVDRNTCRCRPNFEGKYCEFEKKPCLSLPPVPKNSDMNCYSEMCTVKCIEGHKFFDGSSAANLRCVAGQWVPARADLAALSDCQPQCAPPCRNGGVCLSVNVCQCPNEFKGPQCQYPVSACDVRKLRFNGGYKCFGDADKMSCRLSCPAGAALPAGATDLYTCRYDTGQFEPQPIPHCVFDNVVVITPSNYASTSDYSTQANKTVGAVGGASVVVQDLTPKGGRCITWAGMHYKTFDGTIYSFQSACSHVLVQDAREHQYTVVARQPECPRRDYCPAEITVYLEDKPYFLRVAEDGSVVFRSSKRLIPIPAALPGIRVAMPADHVEVALDALGITITWDTNNEISVEGSALAWNRTAGLCGRLGGGGGAGPGGDLRLRDGSVARTKALLIADWQLDPLGDICDSPPVESSACTAQAGDVATRATIFCAMLFSKDKFRKCSQVMDVSQLLEACQWDYCACAASGTEEECACRSAAVLARECARRGLLDTRAWRDADTCPMKCPDGKVYQACGPAVQASCAAPAPAGEANATCAEGCFCPAGQLLHSGRCVQRAECPCRARNKLFPPGATMPKGCNTCTCEAGSWTCTQAACGARCSAVGDPHYTTFDGLRYDFMGHCTYTLLRAENVTIEVENVACSGSITEAMNLTPYRGAGKPSCTKAVSLQYGGASVHMKQGGFILVNGKEVASLPVSVGDIRIRAVSSLFIIVQLPIKVDLWWDGNTRVYVDVPPAFHEKTEGLCGTFNLNQKDDFLTPEGDVEQSAPAFANKWKTREFCADAAAPEPEHPCRANMQNKEAAEKYCGKLKSQLFESCHWYVDVQPYYEACLYDMCACAGDAARCLCPVLGDYAMECAQAGAPVQWRYHVQECEIPCSGGQQYTVCADSCVRTCADAALAPSSNCTPRCVEGCACAPGEVLDDSNACVPVAQCPCYHKGLKFPAGYKEVRAGRRQQDLCTCVGAQWDCVPATDNDIQNYPPAEDLRTSCNASANMEFTTCQVAEPLTCKNMHLPPSATTQECRPGCQCRRGFVLDVGAGASADAGAGAGARCVRPADCPCHHGGRSYPDGHAMKEECNTCECTSGTWSCTKQQCAGACSAWGDSHVSTFDGAQYDFEGVCRYLLAKGARAADDGFSVEIQNEPCGTTGATCSKSVTLRVGGGAAEEAVALTKSVPLPDTSKLKRIKLRLGGAYVFLDVPSLDVSLQWDRGMRVYVRVGAAWQGRVNGLCGNYNADARDDFQSPTSGGLPETSALIFVDSWKLKPSCPKPQEVTDFCQQRPERKEWARATCGAMKRYPFTLCHAEAPPGPWLERCERDACACDAGADCDCACTALAAYAHACAARGVTFKWRTQEMCPMQCDGECSSYSECVSPCPAETCDNTLDYADIKLACDRDTCVEGCKPNKTCPEGSVYSNSSLTECVPRARCKPLCMTLPDGREVLEGEIIEEDRCHTCRCSKKTRVCTGQPCSTEAPTPVTEPHDAPVACASGWTEWLNRGPAQTDAGRSFDREPLPKPSELDSPTCARANMTNIECRTAGDHRSPKETGLNVECSLEKGLTCEEWDNACPDFEIRVYCNCTEELCENPTRPNYPHLIECDKFYECAPDASGRLRPVAKACARGLLYNPRLMVCDWPAAVVALRPECGPPSIWEPEISPTPRILASTQSTVVTSPTTSATSTAPTSQTSPTSPTWPTSPSSSIWETSPSPIASITPGLCPPGKVYSECAYPCDKLCDHFEKALSAQGECSRGKRCVSGCVADVPCAAGWMWRDERTCVPLKDCTCDSFGTVVKPGGVTINGCEKCQCIDNEMHCDSSDCVSYTVEQSSHLPMLSEPPAATPSRPSVATEITIKPTPVLTSTPSTLYTSPPTIPDVQSTTGYVAPNTTSEEPSSAVPIEPSRPSSAGYTVLTTHTPTLPPTTLPPTTPPPTTFPTTIVTPNTASPPPECSPDDYISLLWGTKPGLPRATLSASSAAERATPPHAAVLNGGPLDTTAGYWKPASDDLNQYIQVELERREPIYGIYLQGSPESDQYITSYDVMYGDDGTVFSYIEDSDGKPKVFRGPTNNEEPMKQMFSPAVDARVLRVRPRSWHGAIGARLELIGCRLPLSTEPGSTITTPEPMQCTEPLGLGAALPLDSIEVSSSPDDRQYLTLGGARGWRPLYSTPGEWLMFNFTSPRNLTGIKTKGGPSGWVSVYNVMYTSDLATFNPVVDSTGQLKAFPANFDTDTEVLNEFRPPIHAQYLKILPVKWNKNIEMRVEPIGCFEPYPTTVAPATTTPSPSSPSSPPSCAPCPGVLPELAAACACAPGEYYDGENCVTRDQCPCVVGIITYPVGATFRQAASCDECLCKLGGVPVCKPAETCACAPDLVPKLSPETCECLCEPCPAGTKVCPTSKLCLPLERWCDGLQDCPDDERDCTTTTTTTTRRPVTETVVTTVAPTVGVTKPITELTTVPTTVATTEKPKTCPKVECPPGYKVKIVTGAPSYSPSGAGDLPPPRPRYSYQRYYRGPSKGGFSKGGYSKGGFSKGGYGPQTPPKQNQAFTLSKPAVTNTTVASDKAPCEQFKCIPELPPPFRPGSTPPPIVCSTPVCPPKYSLKLDSVLTEGSKCPQYSCVPPPERPVFCNVTGRTFNTFDGAEYKLDLCFHMLARENRFNSWSVMVRKKCRLEGCRNELLVLQDDQVILVKPDFMIEYDNFEYTVEQTSKICFQKNSFDVGRLGNGLFIKSRKYNFTVLYNSDGDVKIGVLKTHMGRVDGLCGTFDGDLRNDRALPSGKLARSVEQFGDGWLRPGLPPNACKTKAIDPKKQQKVWELCDVITKEPLSRCARVLNLHKWRTICLEKICECTELVVNGSRLTERQCRCLLLEQLVAECLAADRDADLGSWRTLMDCPAECPAPLVHYDCYRKRCEPACSELGGAGGGQLCPAADGQCAPGCYCPEGYLRHGDKCVLPADCLDCTCTGVGTPAKYVTFEGDDLPFLANCTYLASRDHNQTGDHKYQVYATNGPCEENSATICTKTVHLIYEKNVVAITKNNDTKKLITTVNGSPVFKSPTSNEWATITLDNGQDVTVLLRDLHVELRVLQATMQFTVRVPSALYARRTEGLCGACAGDRVLLTTSNGTDTDDFELYGKSWQASPETLTALDVSPQQQCGELPPPPPCALPPPDANPCYNLYNQDKFGACHALVDPQSYLEACEAELCALNATDACPLLARYAAECRRHGVCLAWREGLCPYQCSEPLVYRPCVGCEATCENHAALAADPASCATPPVEGCFCPEGQVRVNNTCIEPSKCFPCDARGEHYAGDQWQEDACTTCSCVRADERARTACVTETCSAPACAPDQDRVSAPPAPGACCPTYVCVPKMQNLTECEEPKKMECGFGQVLKQKTDANGCKEFACECMPASECERIPPDSEVDIMEPGVARVVDDSGCCPRAVLLCRPHTCPRAPACPRFHTPRTANVTGKCCPEHSCELPKDKCIVTLEWEASPQGGEKIRAPPLTELKELDETWLDGPCRSCRCAGGAGAGGGVSAPAPECRVTECPAITSEQFVVEPRAVPFACCPAPVYVACRDGDDVRQVGEKWQSVADACESYECVQLADGRLDKVTTVERCNKDCHPGWKYVEATAGSGKCCGQCEPVACVVDGVVHDIGASWTSDDFCTNYTCVNINGSLQVQRANETCPAVSEAMAKMFVMSEDKVPGQCCPRREPVACRVGNDIYQEGQSWQSEDPCTNYTCARDAGGALTHAGRTSACEPCARGQRAEPVPGRCCPRCRPVACLVDGQLIEPGTEWKSEDNCTTFTCNNSTAEMFVTSAREVCPDVSACPPEYLVNDTCCAVCKQPPEAIATCAPQAVPPADTVDALRVRLGGALCANAAPVRGLRVCRGLCDAEPKFDAKTSAMESPCSCCQPTQYESVAVWLVCADGRRRAHTLASPTACRCARCAGAPESPGSPAWLTPNPWHHGSYGHSWSPYNRAPTPSGEYVPDIDRRFGPTKRY